ncbi:MAG: preprotein translocase subunit SecE [Desulfobacterales bacterium]|nr:preprotein translocase subunit SecE [Desulfobacterales bacterium]
MAAEGTSASAGPSVEKKKASPSAPGKETGKKPGFLKIKSSDPANPAMLKAGKSYLNTVMQFLREVKIELFKVTWPTRKQTIGSTVVVIILSVIIAFFLGAVDIGLSSIVRIVLR